MTIWILRQFHKLILILNSGETPGHIAAGFTIGFLAGATPFNPIYTLSLLLLLALLNVNFASGIFGLALTRLLAPLLDPIFHKIGLFLLVDSTGLEGFWTTLYNLPVIPLTRFNNTVVLGSMVFSLALSLFVFSGLKRLINAYRTSYKSKVENSLFFKGIKTSKLAQWYAKVVS